MLINGATKDDGKFELEQIPNLASLYTPASGVRSMPGSWMFPNLTIKHVRAVNLAAGDNVVYTCPTGRRAMIERAYSTNGNAAANSTYLTATIGGVVYKITTTAAPGGNAASTAFTAYSQGGLEIQAGESFGINASLAGMNISVKILEYDEGGPIVAFRLFPAANGTTTIYTCPAGKKAFPLSANGFGIDFLSGAPTFTGYNPTAGTISFTYHYVRSIDTTGLTTRLIALGGIAAAGQASINAMGGYVFVEDDVLKVETTAVGLYLWGMFVEISSTDAEAGLSWLPSGGTILHGSGAPGSALGDDDDFYIDIAAHSIYGPKVAGAWGSATSLIGPAGAAGANGTNGTNGGRNAVVATKTANYTLVSTDGTILVNSSTAKTMTLMSAATVANKEYVVKTIGTGGVTVAAAGTETIDGSASFILVNQYDSVTVQSDGTNWWVI